MTPKPPRAYDEFVRNFPKLGQAWDLIHQAGSEGPLDSKTVRLVKLGIVIGARQEGAVHSSVRKARSEGITADEVEQVVSLAASTIGLPSTVAAFTWVRDRRRAKKRKRR